MPEDVVIIGGGPAGSTAAIYAARGGLRTLVLDKGISAGALGLAGQVDNYPGVPQVAGVELVKIMREQAQSFGARFKQERVTGVSLEGKLKQIYTAGDMFEARTVIIATGSMGRVKALPGEEALTGRGVSYCATCDGALFRGKAVAVVGDSDEALEETRFLARFAAPLYLVTRKKEPPAALPEGVAAITKATVSRILGEKTVNSIVLRQGNREKNLAVQGVFIYLYGNRPVTGFLGGALPTDTYGCLMVDENMQTAIPGVFAAGDVLCPQIKQAVAAAAEGCRAAMQAIRILSGETASLSRK